MPQQANLQDQQWRLLIKPEIIDELLKYDFVSSKYMNSSNADQSNSQFIHMFSDIAKKGRGASSIVFSQVEARR